MPRKTRAGGAKKRPTRYETEPHDARMSLAFRQHKAGNVSSAEEIYRAVLADAHFSTDAAMNLAAILAKKGAAKEAEFWFRKCVETPEAPPRVWRDAGIGLNAIGQTKTAEDYLRVALERDSSLDGARLLLSRLVGEAGRFEEARSLAIVAVERNRRDASSWLELHRANVALGERRKARECALMAQKLDPTDSYANVLAAGEELLAGETIPEEIQVEPTFRAMLQYGVTAQRQGAVLVSYKAQGIRAALQSAAPGLCLEFGVRHGVSTRILAEAPEARVCAFDSFQGLPEAWQGMEKGAFSTQGEVPALPSKVQLQVGWFDTTIPLYVASLEESPAFVHIDCDLYESAQTVFSHLGPVLRVGTVLLFDEFLANRDWKTNEYRAFAEARERWGWNVEPLVVSWITGQMAFRLVAPKTV